MPRRLASPWLFCKVPCPDKLRFALQTGLSDTTVRRFLRGIRVSKRSQDLLAAAFHVWRLKNRPR
jgi:hypothetical protein